MSFIEELGDTIKTGGAFVADKAKLYSEIASIKAQVLATSHNMNKEFTMLGKQYYDDNKNNSNAGYTEMMSKLAELEDKKCELREKLEQIKESAKAASNSDIVNAVDEAFDSVESADGVDDIVE
ncbi:MAG: hypothetical protein KBT19_05755 [Lachnospiraceae bacterium]|nr:hypothetical protein [Candidatus Colinaster equi]